MLSEKIKGTIATYADFPKKGIMFKDINPLLSDSKLLFELIEDLLSLQSLKKADGIVAIDARGFIFGGILAYKTKKPLILARKKNKLPGETIKSEYNLEYGSDAIEIQKSSLEKVDKVIIIDDLLATGGTAKCVGDLLISQNKEILSLIVVIELLSLKGRDNLSFPIYSQLKL